MPNGPDSYFGDEILKYLMSAPERAKNVWSHAVDSTIGALNEPDPRSMPERAASVYGSIPGRAAAVWTDALKALQAPQGFNYGQPPQAPPANSFDGANFDPTSFPGYSPNPQAPSSGVVAKDFPGIGQTVRDRGVFTEGQGALGSTDPIGDSPAMEFQFSTAPNEVDDASKEREMEVLNIREELNRLEAQRNIAEGFGRMTSVTSGDIAAGRQGQIPFMDEGARRKIDALQRLQEGDKAHQQRKELLRIQKAHDAQAQFHAGLLSSIKDQKERTRTARKLAHTEMSGIVKAVSGTDMYKSIGIAEEISALASKMLNDDDFGGPAVGQIQGRMAKLIDSGKLSDTDVPRFGGDPELWGIRDGIVKFKDGKLSKKTLNSMLKFVDTLHEHNMKQSEEMAVGLMNQVFAGPLGEDPDFAKHQKQFSRGVLAGLRFDPGLLEPDTNRR